MNLLRQQCYSNDIYELWIKLETATSGQPKQVDNRKRDCDRQSYDDSNKTTTIQT